MASEAEVIRFGSLCSGIEAASQAWEPLGWQAAWFSEIEPFPCAVLAHHWPTVPNLGDMTTEDFLDRAAALGDIDVLVGGTPCQAFSLAGLRQGMHDARGQLALTFCDAANAADPAIILWENVPGVLSDRTNGFGCLLAGLAGHPDTLEPGPRPEQGRSSAHWRWDQKAGVHVPKWTDAGYIIGPQRLVAWRVVDAQYFGLAQRRRRVFVVASPVTSGLDPAEILFEFQGVRRDSPPRREKREDVAGTLTGGARRDSGQSLDDVPCVACYGGNNTAGAIDVAPALLAQPGSGWKGDFDSETFVAVKTHRATTTTTDAESWRLDRSVAPTLTSKERDYHDGQTQVVVFTGDGETADPITASEGKCYSNEGGSFRMHNVVQQTTRDVVCAMSAAGGTAKKHGWGSGQQEAEGGYIQPCGDRVRRLMPEECSILQGMDPKHTAITFRGKPAADGPRYKAIGNSMAVNVMRWLGRRIDRALAGVPV